MTFACRLFCDAWFLARFVILFPANGAGSHQKNERSDRLPPSSFHSHPHSHHHCQDRRTNSSLARPGARFSQQDGYRWAFPGHAESLRPKTQDRQGDWPAYLLSPLKDFFEHVFRPILHLDMSVGMMSTLKSVGRDRGQRRAGVERAVQPGPRSGARPRVPGWSRG